MKPVELLNQLIIFVTDEYETDLSPYMLEILTFYQTHPEFSLPNCFKECVVCELEGRKNPSDFENYHVLVREDFTYWGRHRGLDDWGIQQHQNDIDQIINASSENSIGISKQVDVSCCCVEHSQVCYHENCVFPAVANHNIELHEKRPLCYLHYTTQLLFELSQNDTPLLNKQSYWWAYGRTHNKKEQKNLLTKWAKLVIEKEKLRRRHCKTQIIKISELK